MAASSNGRTWAAGGERSGKPDEDLLVFGYSCKLFRDDEKAMLIDRGKHLIPWMGDDSLMIDRYDARGYLHSIGEYEPKPGAALQYAASLTEEERAIEDLCEEERFLALFRDLHEESIYQEEELKRLNIAMNADGTYKETAFSYDSENLGQDMQDTQDEAEIPFKAPKGLHIPVSVPTPSTMKQHAIIEKTALFVSQHGAQMEILVKTKQAGNPQFGFLSFDDPLNVYYRFLVEQLKCGTYVPAQQTAGGNEDSDDEDDHYLHPSLFAASTPAVPTVVSKVFLTKEGEDNAYLQLIKNLKPQLDSPTGGASPSPAQEVEAANHGAAYGYTDGAGYEGCGVVEDYSQPPPPPGLEPILLPSQAVLTGYAIPPPPDVQPIIDKMAIYVAKNGEDFETIVKSKGDKRFEFLLPEHEYHRYYLHKKQAYLDEKAREAAASTEATEPAEPATPVAAEDSESLAAEDLPDKDSDHSVEDGDDRQDVVMGPKLKNGLSIVGEGLGSGSNSPFSNIDSNDATSLLEAPTHGERSYSKGPVSFSLKLKDAEGKDKKRVALGADESDSEEQAEGVPSTSSSQEDTKALDSGSSKDKSIKDNSNKDKKSEGSSSSKDRLSPARQLQLERKKRLAKFLSMIKDAPVATSVTSATSEGLQPDASKGSSGTSTPREVAGRLADVQRAPTDSLPGSPSDTGRERGSNNRAASSPGPASPPRSKSHKSSSKSRHRSRSPSRHRHRHHHHVKEEPARSRSRERHHHKHHRSPRHSHSKRSHSKSPSPVRVKRSRSRRSRSKSPVRRK